MLPEMVGHCTTVALHLHYLSSPSLPLSPSPSSPPPLPLPFALSSPPPPPPLPPPHCLRGHNELDDPSMTQPSMYRSIEKQTSIPDGYAAAIGEEELASSTHQEYTEKLNMVLKANMDYKPTVGVRWTSHTTLT